MDQTPNLGSLESPWKTAHGESPIYEGGAVDLNLTQLDEELSFGQANPSTSGLSFEERLNAVNDNDAGDTGTSKPMPTETAGEDTTESTVARMSAEFDRGTSPLRAEVDALRRSLDSLSGAAQLKLAEARGGDPVLSSSERQLEGALDEALENALPAYEDTLELTPGMYKAALEFQSAANSPAQGAGGGGAEEAGSKEEDFGAFIASLSAKYGLSPSPEASPGPGIEAGGDVPLPPEDDGSARRSLDGRLALAAAGASREGEEPPPLPQDVLPPSSSTFSSAAAPAAAGAGGGGVPPAEVDYVDATGAPDYKALSALLRDNGFAGVRSADGLGGEGAPPAAALVRSLVEVLGALERRGALVQEMLGAQEAQRRQEEALERELRAARRECDQWKSRATKAEHAASLLREAGSVEAEGAASRMRRLEAHNSDLRQQVKQLEAAVRAKGAETARASRVAEHVLARAPAPEEKKLAEEVRALEARLAAATQQSKQLETAVRAKDQEIARVKALSESLAFKSSRADEIVATEEKKKSGSVSAALMAECKKLEHSVRAKDLEIERLKDLSSTIADKEARSLDNSFSEEERRRDIQVAQLEHQVKMYEHSVRAKELEIERLKSLSDSITTKAARMDEFSSREDERRELSQMEHQVKMYEHHLRSKDLEIERLKALATSIPAKAARAEEHGVGQDAAREMEKIQSQVRMLEHSVRAKDLEIERLKDLSSTIADKEARSLDNSFSEEERRRDIQVAQLEHQVKMYEHSVRAKELEIERLKSLSDSITTKAARMDEFSSREDERRELSQMEHQVKMYEHHVRSKDLEIERLKALATSIPAKAARAEEHGVGQDAAREMEKIQSQVRMLEHSVRAKDLEIERLKDLSSTIADKEARSLDNSFSEEERRRDIQVAQLEHQVKMYEHSVRAKELEIERIKGLYDNLVAKHATANKSKDGEAEDEARRTGSLAAQLQQQCKQLEHTVRSKEVEIERLKGVSESISTKSERLEGHLSIEEAKRIGSMATQVEQHCHHLEVAMRAKDGEIERLKALTETIVSKAARLEDHASSEAANAEAAQLEKQFKALEGAARSKDLKIRAQAEEIDRIKNMYDALVREGGPAEGATASSGELRKELSAMALNFKVLEHNMRAKELELERVRSLADVITSRASTRAERDSNAAESVSREVDKLQHQVKMLEHAVRAKEIEVERIKGLYDAVVVKASRSDDLAAVAAAESEQVRHPVVVGLRSEVVRLEHTVRAQELEMERLRALSESIAAGFERMEESSSSPESRRLELVNSSLQQKVTQLEHNVRAKELEVQRLRDKLKDKVEAEERRASSDREVYERLQLELAGDGDHASPAARDRRNALRELRPMEVMRVYERQAEAAGEELESLRAEVLSLSRALRERENLIVDKDRAGGWRTPNHGEQLRRLAAAEEAAAAAARELAVVQGTRGEERRAAAASLSAAGDRADRLAEENAALILEMEARPTVMEMRSAQRRVQILEGQVDRLIRGGPPGEAGQAAEVAEDLAGDARSSAQGGARTRERIRRDREVHRLGLNRVDKLPRAALVELLQDACRAFEVSDPALLPSAISKLLHVVAAVPRMELFIGQCCDVVFRHGHDLLPEGVPRDPAQVPAIVKQWVGDLARLRELEEMRGVMEGLLRERAGEGGGGAAPDTPATIARAVQDLVRCESRFLLARENMRGAGDLVRSEPQELLHKMISHFQELFGCPTVDAVFPTMNHVYVLVSESRNFLAALRSLLGLEKGAGVNTCLATIRQLLDVRQRQESGLAGEYGMGTEPPPEARGAAPEASVSPLVGAVDPLALDGLGVHTRVVAHLLRSLGVQEPTQIVDHVERLLARLRRLDEVLPRYQGVASTLYEVLRVGKLEEIVPRVRDLAAAAR